MANVWEMSTPPKPLGCGTFTFAVSQSLEPDGDSIHEALASIVRTLEVVGSMA